MSKMMVKRDGLWTPMANLKGDTGPLPADNSVTNDALVTDGAKTNTAYLMGNRLTATAEGEMVSVDDSYPSAALSLTVDGKSTQVTTTGKNLLSDVPEEWRRMSGFSGNPSTRFVYVFPMEEGASLSYHRNNVRTLGFIAGWMEDPTDISTYTSIVTLTNYSGYTFTNTNGHAYLAFTVSTALDFSALVMTEAQVEVGTKTTAYEPYSGGAASPRPDWPQDIESIDLLESTIVGKNLALFNDSVETKQGNGLTFTKNGQNLRVSGATTVWNSDSMTMTFASKPFLKAGNKYILSLQGAYSGVASSTFYFRTRNLGETATELHYPSVKNQQIAFIPTKDCIITIFILRIGTTDGDVNVDVYPQLELGSAASEYAPYSGGMSSLLPEGTSLRSLPDGTKDELYLTYLRPSSREGWAWYSRELVKKINTVTFDGSERWVANGAWNGFHIARPSDAPSEGLPTNAFLNTRGIAAVHSRAGLASALGATSFGSDSINYNWDNKTGTSYSGHLTEFKAWLTENNMTIQYLLATPITTQLDPIELPIMQAGTTNIWTDPSTSLSVTYERDRNIVISKLEAAAADLATS